MVSNLTYESNWLERDGRRESRTMNGFNTSPTTTKRGKWLKSRNGAAKRIDNKWLRKEIQRKLLNLNF